MNKQNASDSVLPGLEDRQTAERKLRRLFKSFDIDACAHRDRLIDPYLDRAAASWRPHAHDDFAALAVREAELDLEDWFLALLGDGLDDRANAAMTGRAAFLMCDGPERFADVFLMPLERLPAELIAAMGDHVPNAVPPSVIGDMHHQPYEAWSPTAMVASTLQIEGGSFNWRGIGRTS